MLFRELHHLVSCYRNARRDRQSPPPSHGVPGTAPNIVLLHNSMPGTELVLNDAHLPPGWAITSDRRYASRAVAIIFHIPTLWRLPLRKRLGQLWVAWSLESEVNYPQLADPAFLRHIDIRMTYALDSDVPHLYLPPGESEAWTTPPPPKNSAQLAIAVISSNIHRNGRNSYLAQLMRHLDVHSYGKAMNNRAFPAPDDGFPAKRRLLGQYKFSLAFENSSCPDYVTEKFYDPLVAGSVPVYLGAPNIDHFAPGEHSYINAAGFDSPRHLAEYLNHLNNDDQAYAEYFAWKQKPLRPAFLQQQRISNEAPGVRLCRLLARKAEADRPFRRERLSLSR